MLQSCTLATTPQELPKSLTHFEITFSYIVILIGNILFLQGAERKTRDEERRRTAKVKGENHSSPEHSPSLDGQLRHEFEN